MANGNVVTEANGLVNDLNHSENWYYCSGGQVQLQYSGLAEYDGEWFYLESGKLDTNRVGIVGYDGGLFMVAAGRILRQAFREQGVIRKVHPKVSTVDYYR